MEKIKAKIVADSINQQGDRITTYILTFPRFILAELNTHRVFSKNSASSRAIPFHKMVEMVETDPFIPIAWQKDHKGMQGTEYITDNNLIKRNISIWKNSLTETIYRTKILNSECEVTKQLCNRLLEPFMWHTVLLTGTEFKNFFKLRCPSYDGFSKNGKKVSFKSKKEVRKHFEELKLDTDLIDNQSFESWQSINTSKAEIHMQALAEAMWDAYNESTPKQLKEGGWHIPFGDKISDGELRDYFYNVENNPDPSFTAYQEAKLKVSTARCARLSYMTFDGKVDYEKDIKLHDTLLESHHMSPFEHCARAMTDLEYYSFIKGRVPTYVDDYGIYNSEYYPICYKESINFDGTLGENSNNGDKFGWCRNFKGFQMYRDIIENRYDGKEYEVQEDALKEILDEKLKIKNSKATKWL